MNELMPGNGFLLTDERIDGAHPKNAGYPLLDGDLLVPDPDTATWSKVGPGLGMVGFRLTDEQIARLKPVRFFMVGLEIILRPDADKATSGGWRVVIEGYPTYEERIEIVGHMADGEGQPHWEQFVWPDEAGRVLAEHLATCDLPSAPLPGEA